MMGTPTETMNATGSDARRVDVVDLESVISTCRKYFWPVMLSSLIVALITSVVVQSITPTYTANATLLFESNQSQTGFKTPQATFDDSDSEFRTLVAMLQSRKLAAQLVAKHELAKHWDYNKNVPIPEDRRHVGPLKTVQDLISNFFLRSPHTEINPNLVPTQPDTKPLPLDVSIADMTFDKAVDLLSSRMQIQAVKGTNLIQVKVSGVDRFLATNLANSVSDAFAEIYISRSSTQRSQTKAFLEKKVIDLKEKLEASEQDLLQNRRSVGLTGDGEDFSHQTIALFNNRLVDARTNLESTRLAWNRVKDYIAPVDYQSTVELSEVTAKDSETRYVGTAVEDLPIVDSNPLVQRDKRLAQDATRKLAEIGNRYGEKHPKAIDAMSNLDTANHNLDLQISNVLASVEDDYLAALNLVKSIENDILREETKQYSRNEKKLLIKGIELTRNSNRKLYQDALSNLRTNQEFNLQTIPLTLTDPASVPQSPVKPKKVILTLLSFVVALCAFTIICFTREGMNDSIRSIDDIKNEFNFPILGAVPFTDYARTSTPNSGVIIGDYNKGEDAFTESILSIRTNLVVNEGYTSNQVIMITSSVPEEGKSTIAVNLAYSLANLHKVLLIEADMRRPGLSRGFGDRNYGLSELLMGEIRFDIAVRPDFLGNLDFIPAGSVPDRPLDLLASPKLDDIISIARKKYDRIIIDTAPVQAANDAIVVGNLSDSVIYVTKSHSTSAPIVKLGIDRITEKGIKVAGVVVSQIKAQQLSAYGADYDYPGYREPYISPSPVSIGRGNIAYNAVRVIAILLPLAALLFFYTNYAPKSEAISAPHSSNQTALLSTDDRSTDHRNSNAVSVAIDSSDISETQEMVVSTSSGSSSPYISSGTNSSEGNYIGVNPDYSSASANNLQLVNEEWLDTLSPSLYIIQFGSSVDVSLLDELIPLINRSEPIAVYPYMVNKLGQPVYGIATGLYKSSGEAFAALETLPSEARLYGPWVRSLTALKREVQSTKSKIGL